MDDRAATARLSDRVGEPLSALAALTASGRAPVLRPVVDADADGLLRLVGDAYDEFACGPLDPGEFDADLVAPATSAAARGRRWWVVTDPDGAPAVLASVAHSPLHHLEDGTAAVELHRLYLAPSVRGRGLASALVEGIAAEARRLGATRLVAWSDTRLIAAHARYLAAGFVLSPGSRELHDPAGTTEVRFDLVLDGR